MTDATDELIEALTAARERGLSRNVCTDLVTDVFNAPWREGAELSWEVDWKAKRRAIRAAVEGSAPDNAELQPTPALIRVLSS